MTRVFFSGVFEMVRPVRGVAVYRQPANDLVSRQAVDDKCRQGIGGFTAADEDPLELAPRIETTLGSR